MTTNMKKRKRHLRLVKRRKVLREERKQERTRAGRAVVLDPRVSIRIRRGMNASGEWVKREVVKVPAP